MVDAGWFTDPEAPSQLRWWDGQRWTHYRHPQMVAPLPVAAPPVAPVAVHPAVVPAVVAPPMVAPPMVAAPPAPGEYQPHPPPSSFDPRGAAPTTVATPAPVHSNASNPNPNGKPSVASRVIVFAGIPLSLIVIVALIVGGISLERAPAATPNVVDTPSTSAPSPALPTGSDIDQPGMTGVFTAHTAGGQVSTAAAAFADETSHYSAEKMNARCAPLAFGSPEDGAIQDSANPVTYYTNWVSPSGGTSISGAVQVFASSAEVQDHLAKLAALITSCQQGFTVADGLDRVTIAPGTHVDYERYAWDQVVKTSAKSYTVHSIEWVKGTLVARSWCYQLAGTKDPSDSCAHWATEVQFALKGSH